ncbi:MAG TPA: tetratricopeptide repeat protein [Gaiellaceae bacterium]|nr:tetratricopeptide repeat protein [Gaiellaceae bacterium]
MARADRRSARRARPAPVAQRRPVAVEETMFFPRLRQQAKWVFLFLALAFGLGFVGFGVGAGGVGIGDVFRTGGGSGVPSVSSAQKRVSENPRDVEALRDLVNAQQAAGNTRGAIEALETIAEIQPNDADVLRELAGLYLAQASEAAQRGELAQYRNAYLAPAAGFTGIVDLGGRPLDVDPISNAVSSRLERQMTAAYSEAQQAASKSVEMYRRIAELSPNDPSTQLELAQAAQQAGDITTAISAYEAFLRLAPDDPTAVEVERILKQLRAQSGTTG